MLECCYNGGICSFVKTGLSVCMPPHAMYSPPEELYDDLSPRPSSAGEQITAAESELSSLTRTPSLPSPMDNESRSAVGTKKDTVFDGDVVRTRLPVMCPVQAFFHRH